MTPEEYAELKAYLAANFVVHFIEQIPELKLKNIEQIFKLKNDVIKVLLEEMSLNAFKKTWNLE